MKIFHIVENLDKGAVENWLVSTFIHSQSNRKAWEWTFYCMLGSPGRLDEIVELHGGKILYSPVSIGKKWIFLSYLRKALKSDLFDILHVHHDYLSGFYLLASIGIPFKKRILHVHNNDKSLPVGSRRLESFLLPVFRWLGLKLTNLVIGISNYTLLKFVEGSYLKNKINKKVLYYGVDFNKWLYKTGMPIRQELKLPSESKLIVFIGRLNEFKNPIFVLKILKEIVKINSHVCAVFIGRGDLENELKQRTTDWGLGQNVSILGWRDDIHTIMQEADLFIFPRVEEPKEGLGLVVVESQAAGLPIMVSNGIVDDAIFIPELVHKLRYNSNLEEWVKAALNLLFISKPFPIDEALNYAKKSVFELETATMNLISIYES